MKVKIVGNGSFGTFLKELLCDFFEIVDNSETVILAVPISAYNDVCNIYKSKYLINM